MGGGPEEEGMGCRLAGEVVGGGKMRQAPRDTRKFSSQFHGEGPACHVSSCPALPSTILGALDYREGSSLCSATGKHSHVCTRTWFIPRTHKCHKHLAISIGEVEAERCREIAGQSAEQASPDPSERLHLHTL